MKLLKYRCIGCGNPVNLDPFEICPDCELNKERVPSKIEEDYAKPMESIAEDCNWF